MQKLFKEWINDIFLWYYTEIINKQEITVHTHQYQHTDMEF